MCSQVTPTSTSAASQRTAHQERLRSKYGSWAVVTGASDGIGKAIAEQLAACGLNLILVARRKDLLEAFASDLRRIHFIEVRPLDIDLAHRDAVAKIVAATDGLDVGMVAAIAGFGTSGRFVDSPVNSEVEMVDVNCRVVVELSHHFACKFAAQGRGGLVLMSSLLAFQGVPRAATYAATKAFIQTFAEGLQHEMSRFGVDIIASAPGPVRSGFERRANMRMSAAVSTAVVARQTLNALGRKSIVRPGFLSKFLEASLLPLPRRIRSRILGVVMDGMTRHQNDSKDQKTRRLA